MSRRAARPVASSSRTNARGSLILVVVSVVLFAATRWYILTELRPIESDIPIYLEYSVRAMDLGETPFSAGLPIEYPPAAWWTMAAMRPGSGPSLAPGAGKSAVDAVTDEYTWRFRHAMFLADVVAFAFFWGTLRRRCPALVGGVLLAYVAATALLPHVLYDRLDAGLLCLIMIWAYAWTRAERSGASIAWTVASYAALGLGIAYKIVPVYGLPFLLLAEVLARSRRRLVAALASVTIAVSVPFLVQYAISGPGIFGFLVYHAERGIQVESLYSNLMSAAFVFGSPIAVTFSHGAYELSGPLAGPMMTLSTVALLALFTALLYRFGLRTRPFTLDRAFGVACFAIAASTILSKVLSPQYFIWAIPVSLLLVVDVFGAAEPRRVWLLAGSLLVVAGLTTWITPYHYYADAMRPSGIVPLGLKTPLPAEPWAFVVLAVRNVVYLGVIAVLGVKLWNRKR